MLLAREKKKLRRADTQINFHTLLPTVCINILHIQDIHWLIYLLIYFSSLYCFLDFHFQTSSLGIGNVNIRRQKHQRQREQNQELEEHPGLRCAVDSQ